MEFLRHFITEEIYIVPDTRKDHKTPTQVREISSSNLNSYSITVVSAPLSLEEKKLLDAILNAVNISYEETQTCSEYHNIAADNVLVFGNVKGKPELSFYDVNKNEGKNIILADSLADLIADTDKKRKLWASMKQMFSV